jgi:alpha-L-rhamnosidase
MICATNSDWKYDFFEVELGQIYDGEVVDSNKVDHHWWKAPKAEGKVDILPFPKGKLQTSDAPPVRRIQEIKPQRSITTPSGKTVLDFGQNLVGWVRIETNLVGSGELVFRHAEVMERGELGTRPLRTAKAEVRIKLGGSTKGYEPRYTFFGFR